MQINVDIIKQVEGYSPVAYRCPKGVWTIGYGSTYKPDGSRIRPGDVVNRQVAENMLIHHVTKEVLNRLDDKILNILTISQKSALSSLIYRIGITSFNKSKLKQAILRKDYKTIYMNWDWLGKDEDIHRGLCSRCSQEKAMFFKDKLK